MAPAVATYEPRDPSRTLLYKVIADHLETFLASLDAEAVYDVTMESSFRHPPHEQFLKGQTVIGETLKHRR